MFLQFIIWGSWMVTLGTYLLDALNFTGRQVGFVYGTTALAATVTPLLLGFLADRYFPAEKLLFILHIIGGGVILAASFVQSYWLFYGLMLCYTLCYMPTFSLSNSLCFYHLKNPRQTFPGIRVWGTIAWIVAGLIVSGLGIEAAATPLQIAAGLSIVQAVYCLTLPHTPPIGGQQGFTSLAGPEVRLLLKDRKFMALVLAMAFICLPSSFYYSFVNPYLNEIGWSNAAGKMGIGQVVEIGAVLILPWLLARWSLRWIIFTGLMVWGLRYLAFAAGTSAWGDVWIYTAIAVQGFAFAFNNLAAQIYVDSRVPAHLRNTAQGFVAFLTLGLGVFAGSYIAGETVSFFTLPSGNHRWQYIWLLPAVWGIITAIGFLIGFKDSKKKPVQKVAG